MEHYLTSGPEDAPGLFYIFPTLALESTTFSMLAPLIKKYYFEISIWALGLLTAVGVSLLLDPLGGQSQERYGRILTYTHISTFISVAVHLCENHEFILTFAISIHHHRVYSNPSPSLSCNYILWRREIWLSLPTIYLFTQHIQQFPNYQSLPVREKKSLLTNK